MARLRAAHVLECIAVRIHFNRVSERPAHQLVDGQVQDLARHVPQGDINTADEGVVRPIGMDDPSHRLEMTFDGERVGANQVHPRGQRARRLHVHARFPVAGNSSVGFNSHQAAVALKVQLQRFDGGDLHRPTQGGSQGLKSGQIRSCRSKSAALKKSRRVGFIFGSS